MIFQFCLRSSFRLFAVAMLGTLSVRGAEPTSVDTCVYGGTSGVIAAAVQAKGMNKSVVVVSPDHFLGGMTSGGLGYTDIGDDRILGGLSLEFFNHICEHYQKNESWNHQAKNTFGNVAQGAPAINDQRKKMSLFEPKVAAAFFDEWVRKNDIPVIFSKLDRSQTGIIKNGASIVSIRTLDGHVIKAKMFIDATCEGDLMALAGVSYTIGRVSSSKYGESINGIQSGHHGKQLPRGIDPYVISKDSTSASLPTVSVSAFN